MVHIFSLLGQVAIYNLMAKNMFGLFCCEIK